MDQGHESQTNHLFDVLDRITQEVPRRMQGPQPVPEAQQLLDMRGNLARYTDIFEMWAKLGEATSFMQTLDVELLTLYDTQDVPKTDQAKTERGISLLFRYGPTLSLPLRRLVDETFDWSDVSTAGINKRQRDVYVRDYPLAPDMENAEMVFQRNSRSRINKMVAPLLRGASEHVDGVEDIDTVAHAAMVQARLGTKNSYSRYIYNKFSHRYDRLDVFNALKAAREEIDTQRAEIPLPIIRPS